MAGQELPANGRLFGFGQTGFGTESLVLEGDELIVAISCGANHFSLLCDSGKVFMLGSNSLGQLGLGIEPQNLTAKIIDVPTQVSRFDKEIIKQVACGGFHTLFCTDAGGVFACGDNYYGQLGLGYNAMHTTPVLIPRLERMVLIGAGGSHSVALAASGQVYIWGSNGWGELGFGHRGGSLRTPTQLAINNEPVATISCGSYHNTFVTEEGSLFVYGGNYSGQLGLATEGECITPHVVNVGSTIKQAVCGARHTVALTDAGDVWAWGDNENGQVGVNEEDTSKPRLVLAGQKVIQVACGDTHTVLLTEGGKVLSFGTGKGRPLGFEDDEKRCVPTVVSCLGPYKISLVACGANMTLAFSTEKSDLEHEPVQVVEETQSAVALTSVRLQCHPRTAFSMLKFLESALTCPRCQEYLVPPIFYCVTNHNVCNTCSHSVGQSEAKCVVCAGALTAIRNSTLETLGSTLEMPCKLCGKMLSAPNRGKHALECPKKTIHCPVEGCESPSSCHWKGPRNKLAEHTLSTHRDHMWCDPVHMFVQVLCNGTFQSEVVQAFDHTFVFYHLYDTTLESLQMSVACISDGQNFSYEFFVNDGIGLDQLTLRKKVCVEKDVLNEESLNDPQCLKEKFVTIPKNLLENFVEDKQLKHCSLAIVRPGDIACRTWSSFQTMN